MTCPGSINFFKTKFGFVEPDRGLDKESPLTVWRYGKMPDYTNANLSYFMGKTQNHKAGSLEELVENLVKTWEMEASHKPDLSQWRTIEHGNYSLQANGGAIIDGEDAAKVGNYNALMADCKEYKKYNLEDDFEGSHDLFRGAFQDGFPWELLKVLSGPPHVIFTWRHWGKFNGEFRGKQGSGEVINVFGLCRVTVNADTLKIQHIEAFLDGDEFLQTMEGKFDPEVMTNGGNSLLGEISTLAIDKLSSTNGSNCLHD